MNISRQDSQSKFRSFFFLKSLEALWTKERQLYTEQIQQLEQSLVETKKFSIDQQTQIMQLKVQLESAESQVQAQVLFEETRSLNRILSFSNRIDRSR